MRLSLRALFPIFLTLVASASAAAPNASFPNYFLKPEYRSASPETIPDSEVERVRPLIEKAMLSVFNRVTVPVVPPGESESVLVRFFPYMHDHLAKIDPNVRDMPSAGLVRAVWGYLYAQVYEGEKHRAPPIPAEETLRRIALAHDDIPSLDLRGIGSDFDLLIKSEKLPQIQAKGLEIANSAESRYFVYTDHREKMDTGLLRTLFSVGDLKGYDEQINRSTAQGGAEIDFLAFDRAQGKVVEPPQLPGIVSRLIRGEYAYHPPKDPKAAEDIDKQLVRGPRALLEVPYLRIQDETQIRRELEAAREKIRGGGALSFKALEQFGKMMRNSRWGGANNRFHRARAGTVEAEFLNLAEDLRGRTGINYLPEFVDTHPLQDRAAFAPRSRELPKDLLIPVDRFVDAHTDQGTIYHGTDTIENGLTALRQGLYLSSKRQGRARKGRGAYATHSRSLAGEYAKGAGIVLDLKLRNDPRLKVA